MNDYESASHTCVVANVRRSQIACNRILTLSVPPRRETYVLEISNFNSQLLHFSMPSPAAPTTAPIAVLTRSSPPPCLPPSTQTNYRIIQREVVLELIHPFDQIDYNHSEQRRTSDKPDSLTSTFLFYKPQRSSLNFAPPLLLENGISGTQHDYAYLHGDERTILNCYRTQLKTNLIILMLVC